MTKQRKKRPAALILSLVLLLIAACGPDEKEIGPPRLDLRVLEAPSGIEAFDTPGDRGGAITLSWNTSRTENTPDFLIRNEIKRQ